MNKLWAGIVLLAIVASVGCAKQQVSSSLEEETPLCPYDPYGQQAPLATQASVPYEPNIDGSQKKEPVTEVSFDERTGREWFNYLASGQKEDWKYICHNSKGTRFYLNKNEFSRGKARYHKIGMFAVQPCPRNPKLGGYVSMNLHVVDCDKKRISSVRYRYSVTSSELVESGCGQYVCIRSQGSKECLGIISSIFDNKEVFWLPDNDLQPVIEKVCKEK